MNSKVSKSARRMMRLLLIGVILYGGFLAGMFVVMRQPPHRFGQLMAYFPMPAMIIVPFEPMWNVARRGAPRVGQLAPDFTLPTIDHKADVTLSSFRGKQPVVLVFGSFT